MSHRAEVEGVRGHTYRKPVATMRAYLKAMREAPYIVALTQRERPPTVVAAFGPRMMALSGELADGAHPYNTTRRTARRRGHPWAGQDLGPEVWVLLETDRARARAGGARGLLAYLQLENYVNGWRGQGFWRCRYCRRRLRSIYRCDRRLG